MDLDYEHCAEFLARLDADAEIHPTSTGPLSITPTISPVDRTSSSPSGFSSAALSPESFKFSYDDSYSVWNDPSFLVNESTHNPYLGLSWDTFMQPPSQQPSQKQRDVVSPGLSDEYIKTEDTSYFANQPMTISPRSSLLDPNASTAFENGSGFPYSESGPEPLFGFDNFDHRQQQQQQQQQQKQDAWRPQAYMKEDFAPVAWQQLPPQQQRVQQPQPQQQQQQIRLQQQQQQQQQQRQPQPAQVPMYRGPSPTHSHRTTSSPDSGIHESHDDMNAPRSKKRKTSDTPEPISQSPPQHNVVAPVRKQQPKKTAHNMIEKRYRTNLNEKIAALRDSVPSLRVMAGTSKLGDDDEEEDLEGLTPAHKLNKATVLAKATEYIRHLEKRSKKLQEENEHLKNRLSAFEKLATMGGAMAGGPGGRTASTGPGGGLMSRLMVGSLAGLMVANGLQEQEGASRGLFALPFSFAMPFDLGISTPSMPGHSFWLIFKVLLLFTAIMYVFTPGFFDSRPKKPKAIPTQPNLSAVPSLASPLEVRRRAWLTAIQTVSVPQGSLFLELGALALKFMKLGLRQLVGWDGYSLVTGMTLDQENARIKAWTIALDAQLAGGDEHVSHSRLLLSLLASFTLPATPARLMLNSLHIRVLFWDLSTGFQSFAQKLATYYWNEARRLHKTPAQPGQDVLHEHLAQLLELEASDVLIDRLVQRAYNLTYNRPTAQSDSELQDEGMNSVVGDLSIRSPLDALAGWYSSLLLRRACLTSLKSKPKAADLQAIEDDLDVALRVAPPTSSAQLRVLASRAVLLCAPEGKDLQTLLKLFKDDFAAAERGTKGKWGDQPVIQNRLVTVTADIKVALRCAMTLTMIKQGTDKARKGGIRLFTDLDWSMGYRDEALAAKQGNGSAITPDRSPAATPTPQNPRPKSIVASQMGLLGFTVAWKTLTVIVADPSLLLEAHESIEQAAGTLRRWSGMDVGKQAGVGKVIRRDVGEFCTELAKRIAGIGEDAGYVSGERAEVVRSSGTLMAPEIRVSEAC